MPREAKKGRPKLVVLAKMVLAKTNQAKPFWLKLKPIFHLHEIIELAKKRGEDFG